MVTEVEILSRVRMELGDQPEPFRQTFRGNGHQDEFDLPSERVSTSGLRAFLTNPDTLENTTLRLDDDFEIDAENGVVHLNDFLTRDWLLTVEGLAYGLFTDEELTWYVHDAILQHTHGATDTTRYRDSHGFIKYETVAKTLADLDPVEEHPVAMLGAINAFWALLADAATDIDVTTSEGTHIARSQRFAQIQTLLATLEERYRTICAQLNVGLFRIEVLNLRRVSRQTGRLVPLYKEREYDDHTPPVRIVPEVDGRDADPDGPPSPYTNQGY